jgi:AmmeMemoRadiSam system protein A
VNVDSRHKLLRLARSALDLAVLEGRYLTLPPDLADDLLEAKGCFVTLTRAEQLRGCIGNIYPEFPLAEAVARNAFQAAMNDPRFSAVGAQELLEIAIEVSVLTVPAPLAFESPSDLLQKLQPHRDGVVLMIGSHRSTFLPQVWEKLPEPSQFLDHLSIKAGLSAQAWRRSGTEVLTYQVEAFSESELQHLEGK